MPNRLIHEKSPYLLQHAHNPVDWYPWSEEAFEKARQENKPVFLSIGYATCHWCHVMERESFEDEEAASALNDAFVSIKVDREERPDIDAVYMAACHMVSGSGGWPLNVMLTPGQKTLFRRHLYAQAHAVRPAGPCGNLPANPVALEKRPQARVGCCGRYRRSFEQGFCLRV